MTDHDLNILCSSLEKLRPDKRVVLSAGVKKTWLGAIREQKTMDAAQLESIVRGAVASALAAQKQDFDAKLIEINNRITGINMNVPVVEPYKDIEIRPNIKCDETLDVVKSLSDFEGKQETYVAWRKAAQVAYSIFKDYDGSSKHYQAVAIIRNKIKGSASTVLASFNTALNFKAIIDRLDFTYSDKRPIYLLERDLSTLRQGSMSLVEYYEQVEQKLALLTNKTIMTYETDLATALNEKYRSDALCVFISGAKKALSDVLFSARPKDLPSALALAQEVEANHERYSFAASYAKSLKMKVIKNEQRTQQNNQNWGRPETSGKNPNYNRNQRNGSNNGRFNNQNSGDPMEVDLSSKFRLKTNHDSNQSQQGQAAANTTYFKQQGRSTYSNQV